MKKLNDEEMRCIEGGGADTITSVYYGWFWQNNKLKWGIIKVHKYWTGKKYITYRTYGY